MGTNSSVNRTAAPRGPYKHHPLAFKRAVVEESPRPGTSVARTAREHGINANQLFLWRKTYREGMLHEASPLLLPVTIEQNRATERSNAEQASGFLLLESARLSLRIEGRPDPETLRVVLVAGVTYIRSGFDGLAVCIDQHRICFSSAITSVCSLLRLIIRCHAQMVKSDRAATASLFLFFMYLLRSKFSLNLKPDSFLKNL
jgi:transposase